MKIDTQLRAAHLAPALSAFWKLSGEKIQTLEKRWRPTDGSPVFTVKGKYTSKGWTEWTQGFQFGSALLQFDAAGGQNFLEIGRRATLERMAPHLTHTGVHDHGFNNVSTYGNLWRLMNDGRIKESTWERNFYELALKVTGAVQASRWTELPAGLGYIYSFNGPHSLFADTIRSLRALALSHRLGHVLQEENDRRVSLLGRLVQHAETTARFAVYYNEGRDAFDVRGRVAHESIFNLNDGAYRCPNSQQGFSPFTTWTRGLAWIMLGFAEELEFLRDLPAAELKPFGGWAKIRASLLKAACASCDFYIDHAAAADGVPYWDTGAPNLHRLGDWQSEAADPYNDFEPVDASAAAIGAQGLLRLGHFLASENQPRYAVVAERYTQAGLTVLRTLLDEPYLSTQRKHEGLLLHSVYHQPRGWDYVPKGRRVPCDESSQWGDYHLREAALYVQRLVDGAPRYTFFADGRTR